MSTYPLVHGRRFELPAVGPVLAAMCTVKLRDGAQRTLDDWWRIMFTTGPQPRVGPTGVAWRVGDIAGTTPWDHATPQLALAALVEPAAADMLGISVHTLRRRIAAGELPAFRTGRRIIRVRVSDLERLLRRVPSSGSW